jgi:hypothetical protein
MEMKTQLPDLQSGIHPLFITGFVDGEGCFYIKIVKNSTSRTGYLVQLTFGLILHAKDLDLLKIIQAEFKGVGHIWEGKASLDKGARVQYQISSIKDIKILINHLDKYPLLTQKWSDYQLFKQAFELIERKEHLTQQGLEKLVSIKASMNNGLADELKAAFPEIIPVKTPQVKDKVILNPNLISGFVTAEGCFNVQIYKSKTKLKKAVQLRFYITQHNRDTKLMQSLMEFWDCGNVTKRLNEPAVDLKITKLDDLNEKVIPLFQKHPILGIKHLDYLDFVKVIELMKKKDHLTTSGLNQICRIKNGMNTGREVS